jgi:hypothetical protein
MLVCRPPSQLQFKTQWKIMKFTRVHYQNLQFLNLLLFSKNSPFLLCVTVVQVTLVTEICLKSTILTTLVAILITSDVVNKIDIYTLLMNWQYNSACKISILFSESQILKKGSNRFVKHAFSSITFASTSCMCCTCCLSPYKYTRVLLNKDTKIKIL